MRLFTKLFALLALVGTVEAAESPYYLSLSGNYYQQHKSKALGKHILLNNVVQNQPMYTKYDPGYGSIFAMGYKYDQWRFELEGFYRQHKVNMYQGSVSTSAWDYVEVIDYDSNDKIKSYGTALNAYYDWSINKWKPYLGLGVGLEREVYTDDDTRYTEKNNSSVYQFMAGIAHPIADSLDWFAEYRFFNSFKRKEYEDDDGDYVAYKSSTSILNLGVRYHF